VAPTDDPIVPIETDPTDLRSAAATGSRANKAQAIGRPRDAATGRTSRAAAVIGRTSRVAVGIGRISRVVAATGRISRAAVAIGPSRRGPPSNVRPTRAPCRFASIRAASTR